MVVERQPPPSSISSKGGDVVVVVCQQKKHPLHLAFRAREGLVVVACQQKHPLRLAFRAREGLGGGGETNVSHFEQGGSTVVVERELMLCCASCISSHISCVE